MLTIQNCSSSDRFSNTYACEKLFDGTTTTSSSWRSDATSDWVQLNLDERYYLHSLKIFQLTNVNYRIENITLEIANTTILNTTIDNDFGWKEIIMPRNITSTHLKLIRKSKYGTGKAAYIPEIKVLGGRIGNVNISSFHSILKRLLFVFTSNSIILYPYQYSKVDCKWSEYDDWSGCSESCGNGIKTSKRVKVQNALHGGKECEGESERVEECNLEACPGNRK